MCSHNMLFAPADVAAARALLHAVGGVMSGAQYSGAGYFFECATIADETLIGILDARIGADAE